MTTGLDFPTIHAKIQSTKPEHRALLVKEVRPHFTSAKEIEKVQKLFDPGHPIWAILQKDKLKLS